MNKIKMVDLNGQFDKIRDQVETSWNEVISNTAFINGPQVKSFSSALGNYLGTNYVIPCANGTDALQIALMALKLPKGSEILVPAFNYVASAEVIALLGFQPIFFDADPDYFNGDTNLIEDKISGNTKAIIAVHLFGQSTFMDKIMSIAKSHNLYVIEDNAQGIGGYFHLDGHKISNGLIGDIGTTSFFPSKNLGCFGDGGAIYTKHEHLFEILRQIANHGQVSKYNYEAIGVNSRLDTLQAALLEIKLKHLDDYISARRTVADYYDQHLQGLEEIITPKRFTPDHHVFHQYTMKVKNGKRDALRDQLQKGEIPTMIYYPSPLHLNKAYAEYGYKQGDFPIAEGLSSEVLSLPIHTEMEEDQISYICENIIKALKEI